jgi:hypothetical protein
MEKAEAEAEANVNSLVLNRQTKQHLSLKISLYLKN